MIFNRIFRSSRLPEDLVIIALGILLCLPLLLSLKPYDYADATETASWISIVSRGFLVVCSFLIFSRLRDQGGAAAIFLLGHFFLKDQISAGALFSYLNEVYLGLGFWAVIFFTLFRLLELLRNKRSDSVSINETPVSDNEFINLKLNG